MRTVEINKSTIFYALKIGQEKSEFGEIANLYTDPIPYRVNVQSGSAGAAIASAGVDIYNGLRLITADTNLPWDEFTLFWIYNPPTAEYDYVMGKPPARDINGVTFYVDRRGDM